MIRKNKIKKKNENKTNIRDIKFHNIFTEEIIRSEKNMKEEKKRLGLPTSKVVFTGASVIAQMFWCEKKAYFDAQDEFTFFTAYLSDNERYGPNLTEDEINKILYPEYVNRIKIKGGHEILLLQDKVKLSDEDKEIFSKMTIQDYESSNTKLGKWFKEFLIKNKIKKHVLIPKVNIEKNELNYFIESKFMEVNELSQTNFKRGRIHELKYAEEYPSIRYHFRWGNYIIEAIPDGIGKDFCYEFKSTKKEVYIPTVKTIANAQAQLYSYFFKREKVRIQIYAMDANKVFTFEENTDPKFVESILTKFDNLMSGSIKIEKVPVWKCYKCMYKDKCDVSSLNKNSQLK